MCSFYEEGIHASHADLIAQLEYAMERCPGEAVIKIFTSGSFFDEREIKSGTRKEIMERLNADRRVRKVIVESRPEFVTHKNISPCMDILESPLDRFTEGESERSLGTRPKFEVSIGVETSDDLIRDRCINKGFSFTDFIAAAEIARECGSGVKAYLLLKPPFLSEHDAIEDTIRSVEEVSEHVSTISVNPCCVQRATKVHELWKNDEYRPPWLWSVVEVLKRAKEVVRDTIIMSDPVAAGMKRGPHNCGKCDSAVRNAIRRFSLTQDNRVFDDLGCDCKEIWGKVLDLEDFAFGLPLVT
jgi:hypothetical protein